MKLFFGRLNSLLGVTALMVTVASAQTPLTPRSSLLKPSVFSILGTVVSASTGAPVPQCHVSASLAARGGRPRRVGSQQEAAETDERGHFTLALPSAGSWSLQASAPGYRTQLFDQHESFSSAVVLTEQVPTYDVLFRIHPDSAITGVVLDEGSEPVRQAQVFAYSVFHPVSEGELLSRRTAEATTDDRGRYEIDGLAPGKYRLSVQARPWYGTAAQTGAPRADASQLDPSLDVVYPVTWFPGSADEAAAEVVTLHDGETREADVALVPIPSTHLRIAGLAVNPASQGASRDQNRSPQVQRISPAGNFLPVSVSQINGTNFDIGGLAPGLYRVQMPGENGQPGQTTLIEIRAGSARTVDLSSAAVTATVTLKIDGSTGSDSLPIVFRDVDNDQNVFGTNDGRAGGGFQRGPPVQFGEGQPQSNLQQGVPQPGGQRPLRSFGTSNDSRREHSVRTVELPPGRYIVTQEGSTEFFLTGMTLGVEEIPGRIVTIPNGSSSLTLHMGSGRASVSGIATSGGRPAVGAMVVLVPVTINQSGSIAEPRRDQTNTDGSFDLSAVIPGQYILIAIDQGWNANWSNSSTLSRYLTQGVPLDLRTPVSVKQSIEVQLP